jgi:hypothetical protein
MKFVGDRAFSDPEVAARKLVEIANTVDPVADARIFIELVNLPFLRAGGTPDEYRAGLKRAIEKGWFELHESGSYLKFTQAGAELFA